MNEAPLLMRWEGDGFTPANAYVAKRADQIYVVGQVYRLIEHQDRSKETHNHYFASIAEAWKNLPDHLLAEYPSPEHLRKKMLVRCGFADERSVVCSSNSEALRIASFVRPLDEYAVVIVRETVVRVFTAQSQSMKSMGRKVFQDSKSKVLDALDDLLEVERGTIAKHAGKAA